MNGVRVLFIPSAAITPETLHYVELCRDELLSVGVKRDNILDYDLIDDKRGELPQVFEVNYVCVGYTLHLLSVVRRTGFDKIIRDSVAQGSLYGVSAGSIILGPIVKHETGLCLHDAAIYPHYSDAHADQVRALEKGGCSVMPLRDNQAVLVRKGRPAELIE